MKNKKQGASLLFLFCFFIMLTTAQAEVVPIAGVAYDVEQSMKVNLQTLLNKRVEIMLINGRRISGVIENVGSKMLHLKKLSGKDFFDALIDLQDIVAVETQFRQIKRRKIKIKEKEKEKKPEEIKEHIDSKI